MVGMPGDSSSSVGPRVTICSATHPSSQAMPCAEWIEAFDQQARMVAGGGAVAGRIATGRLVAARSVSERAEESLRGLHRCCRLSEHVSRFGTEHFCGCGYMWTEADDALLAPEPDGPM